jgi:hypothetical protein
MSVTVSLACGVEGENWLDIHPQNMGGRCDALRK